MTYKVKADLKDLVAFNKEKKLNILDYVLESNFFTKREMKQLGNLPVLGSIPRDIKEWREIFSETEYDSLPETVFALVRIGDIKSDPNGNRVDEMNKSQLKINLVKHGGFDYGECSTLRLFYNPDTGELIVTQGNHRTTMLAVVTGFDEDALIMCEITLHKSGQSEFDIYQTQSKNHKTDATDRASMTPDQKFKSGIASGDKYYQDIYRLLWDCNLSVGKMNTNKKARKISSYADVYKTSINWSVEATVLASKLIVKYAERNTKKDVSSYAIRSLACFIERFDKQILALSKKPCVRNTLRMKMGDTEAFLDSFVKYLFLPHNYVTFPGTTRKFNIGGLGLMQADLHPNSTTLKDIALHVLRVVQHFNKWTKQEFNDVKQNSITAAVFEESKLLQRIPEYMRKTLTYEA